MSLRVPSQVSATMGSDQNVQSPSGFGGQRRAAYWITASRTTPTEFVLVRTTGPSTRPDSRTQAVPVISPFPLSANTAPKHGRVASSPRPRGRIAVRPVRTDSPSISVVWPTAPPATSVIAFQRPVGPKAKGTPRSRARTGAGTVTGASAAPRPAGPRPPARATRTGQWIFIGRSCNVLGSAATRPRRESGGTDMPVWSEFVDVIYATLVCVSTALGGSMGLAIAVVSLVMRVLLLPLTLRLAYRALEVQAAVKKIEPQLARIREKYKSDQRRVMEETARLYQANGIKLVDGGSLLGTAVQAPIFLGLFSAIRRGLAAGGRLLWIKDLALPDAALAVC